MFLQVLNWLLPKHNLYYSSSNKYLTAKEINQYFYPRKIPISKKYTHYLTSQTVLANFKEPLILDLIHRIKFFLETAIVFELAEILVEKLISENLPLPDLITWVPPDQKRLSARGFHLSKFLAILMGQKLGIKTVALVKKIKTTQSQTKLDKKARLLNLNGVFKIEDDFSDEILTILQNGKIWLVDDVITTGTTLGSVATVLQTNFTGVQIFGVAIAG